MATYVDAIVVGGGAVGCAIARALTTRAFRPLQVAVLEKNSTIGSEVSSRSSEVLHAGLYYGSDNYKTKLCIRGRELLEQYMTSRQISHEICGKIVVSTSASANELHILGSLYENGQRNGLSRLEWWSTAQTKIVEPQVSCTAAIFSPYSGIFDTHSVLQSFQVDIEESSKHSIIVKNCEFLSARQISEGFLIESTHGTISTKLLINAAGLNATKVASKVSGYPSKWLPSPFFAKGHYLRLRVSGEIKSAPFSHLVYPLPSSSGLGTHATLDLNGGVRFGPDVKWLQHNPSDDFTPDYSFDENIGDLIKRFKHDIERYWPNVVDDRYSLVPDYTGIRPKVVGPGSAASDFLILREREHGIPNLVQLFGIESPGWTSSMAIGELIANEVLND